MTNHWVDLQNCKTILVEGSNVAENHPMAFKWIRKAQENGATIIHVDPRFTRTSGAADMYARIRPGTDAALQNAMINHIIVNKLYDEDYVVTHTNALYLGDEAFDFKDGVFSGYDAENHKYDTKTWGYQLDAKGYPRVARSLEDPHCVFTRLKTFVSRYTLEMGERITGIPAAQIKQIAETMAKNRPGSILYALGMTQHTTGVQGIRAFTILQLLLGNIGKPGGGVNALRGEPNVQGACDMAVLYNYYPGYLNSPTNAEPTIFHYARKNGIADSKYLVNMLKAFFGDAATKENDYAYEWLPKRNAAKDYGTLQMFEDALAGNLKLLWIVGQNPAVTLPNLTLTFDAMAKLETLVVQEIWETETAAFWKRPGVDPKSIDTEVILLPAAFFMEKNGTISNSGGMVQWRHAAVKPPGEAKPDGLIVDMVFRAVRDLVKDSKEPRDAIIQRAFWTYTTAEDVLKEINGFAVRDNPETGLKKGDLVRKTGDLKADGSTSSGAWIYAGVFAGGENLSKRRDSQSDPGGLGLYPGFGWTWPNNMRILYNRASCDRNGKPYPGSKPIVWWDEKAKRWTGYDVPDVPVVTDGPDTPNGQRPFHLGAEGVGRLFAAVYKDPDPRFTEYWRDVAYVPKDGPLPEMYEPVESAVENVLHPGMNSNPMVKYPRVASHQPIGTVDKYPYVLMTSTVAEHWCAGSTTRNIPWLNELVPEPVLELPVALGQQLGVRSGDWVRVTSARGELEVKALVTPRMKALMIGDREVTVVWMPYNWGFQGLSTGPSVNHLTIDASDPGAGTQETKACLVNVVRARPGHSKIGSTEGAHMTTAATEGPIRSTLIDITNCIGCRACQVACKQWNEQDGEDTELEPGLGFQNPAVLSAKTYTLIAFHEFLNPEAPGGLETANVMQRCLHCLEPACVSACPTTALYRQADGPVSYEEDKCIGCRYCVLACPWDVPTSEWNTRTPKISKCTHCADRAPQPVPVAFNGKPLADSVGKRFMESIQTPACVKACPADALRYGTREEMLEVAHKRIADRPDKYVDHIYGEKELGGTSVLYLSKVPFEKLGFPTYGEKPYPAFTKSALGAVPPAVMAVGALLGAAYAFFRKRVQAVADGSAAAKHSADHGHVAFEPLPNTLLTPFNWALIALMAFGGLSLVARFVLGLGGSTNLSDTYPWGLWILFDLVWIAVAAGAFAMAGIIYVFQRKDLYPMGRTAVLMGLLSYSFVMVTLLADLGRPLHSYQLALNAPHHSAMFEVSWCVGLYITILLLEFLPVPLGRFGYQRAAAALRRWNGAYVAGAVTLFIYLMSRNVLYALATAVVFGTLAWLFRARDEKAEPIMLAIAAVTLSSMHQSSLGSLYLLMGNMLAPQWWSPLMPVSFFLSSIAAGTALVILIEMWIAKGWRRPLEVTRLASVGQITFWALAVYLGFRLGDMAIRGQLAGAFSGRLGVAFAAEIILGGVLPLVFLGRKALRERTDVLFIASLLAVLGVTYNRMNVVLFAMTFKGRMPWAAPESYAPSVIEWGISVGLIAATIFLFGLAARHMPVLPRAEPERAH